MGEEQEGWGFSGGLELKGVELRHKVGGGRSQGRCNRTQGRGKKYAQEQVYGVYDETLQDLK